jgi:hypothetical protein
VIYPLRSQTTWAALARIAPLRSELYYLGITLPPSDLEWLNTVKLPPDGMRIRLVAGFGEMSLYSFDYVE